MRFALAPVLAALVLAVAAAPVLAQVSSPNGGAVLSIHTLPLRAGWFVVPQPDTGALALVLDSRSGSTAIYAQRVDRRGRPQLPEDGQVVWNLNANEYPEDFLADGTGGALIVSSVNRGATGLDIVVRRVLPDGSQPYGANGLVVCNAARDQVRPRLAAGPAGSYYVGWVDDRANAGYYQDLYVQRLTVAGAPQWAANGLLVNSATYRAESGNGFVGWGADGLGGLAMIWWTGATPMARAQRMNSAGALAWTANGIAVGTSNNGIQDMAADGSGGFWTRYSTWDGTYSRYYAHHVLPGGTIGTAGAGVEFYPALSGASLDVKLMPNASGGCFVFAMLSYYSNPSYHTLLRQELSGSGSLLRGTYGDAIASVIDWPSIVLSNNSILVGMHERVASDAAGWQRVQRYALDGTPFHPGSGVLVGRTNVVGYALPTALALDAGGNLFAAWGDTRYSRPGSPANYQAFGQALSPAGQPLWDDAELPVLKSAKDAPNDQGGYVRVTWDRSIADHPAAGAATGYRVWRALPAGAAAAVAKAHPATAGLIRHGSRLLLAQAGLYWEMAGEQPAATMPQYALTVPTMQDSMAGDPATQSFLVEAYDDSSHHWFSGVLTARSVDNLAPSAVTSAFGVYASGTTSLFWNGVADADLCCYEVFRGSAPGFPADDAHRIGSTAQLSSVDDHGAPAYYRIAARDVHGNLGPSALVVPQGTAGVEDGPPRAWTLRSAWSASSHAIELALDLPGADEGRIELYDVSGRRLWSRPWRAEGASVLTFRVDDAPGLRPGLVIARARSVDGRELRTKTVVLR